MKAKRKGGSSASRFTRGVKIEAKTRRSGRKSGGHRRDEEMEKSAPAM